MIWSKIGLANQQTADGINPATQLVMKFSDHLGMTPPPQISIAIYKKSWCAFNMSQVTASCFFFGPCKHEIKHVKDHAMETGHLFRRPAPSNPVDHWNQRELLESFWINIFETQIQQCGESPDL